MPDEIRKDHEQDDTEKAGQKPRLLSFSLSAYLATFVNLTIVSILLAFLLGFVITTSVELFEFGGELAEDLWS